LARAVKIILNTTTTAMNAAVKEVVGEVPQFDDVTMLCVEYKGAKRPA
jgi:hypothetical protein